MPAPDKRVTRLSRFIVISFPPVRPGNSHHFNEKSLHPTNSGPVAQNLMRIGLYSYVKVETGPVNFRGLLAGIARLFFRLQLKYKQVICPASIVTLDQAVYVSGSAFEVGMDETYLGFLPEIQ